MNEKQILKIITTLINEGQYFAESLPQPATSEHPAYTLTTKGFRFGNFEVSKYPGKGGMHLYITTNPNADATDIPLDADELPYLIVESAIDMLNQEAIWQGRYPTQQPDFSEYDQNSNHLNKNR